MEVLAFARLRNSNVDWLGFNFTKVYKPTLSSVRTSTEVLLIPYSLTASSLLYFLFCRLVHVPYHDKFVGVGYFST